jgi:hypothetical protein
MSYIEIGIKYIRRKIPENCSVAPRSESTTLPIKPAIPPAKMSGH